MESEDEFESDGEESGEEEEMYDEEVKPAEQDHLKDTLKDSKNQPVKRKNLFRDFLLLLFRFCLGFLILFLSGIVLKQSSKI